MGNEDLQVIQEFLAEYNEQTGEQKSIVDSITEPVTNVVNPDDSATKKNKPTLQVIEGGKGSGLASALTSVPSLDDLPTPAGISFLLFFALFVLFALMPAKGKNDTRLSLAWKAVMGRVAFQSSSGSSQSTQTQTQGTGWDSAGQGIGDWLAGSINGTGGVWSWGQ